jgi:hypothetical protein
MKMFRQSVFRNQAPRESSQQRLCFSHLGFVAILNYVQLCYLDLLLSLTIAVVLLEFVAILNYVQLCSFALPIVMRRRVHCL